MKKIFLITFALLNCIIVSADSAWPDSVLVHQPDGTNLWVYDRGDEFFNWAESTDGFVIVRNTKGVFEYATVNNSKISPSGIKAHNVNTKQEAEINYAKSQCKQVKTALNQFHNETCKKVQTLRTPHIPSSPVVGTRKVLTILAQFPDKLFSYSANNFDSIMNIVGYSGHGNAGSVRDYYYENSYGQLNIQSTVIGPFTAANNSNSYSRPIGADAGAAANLVREAITWADNNGVDFSTFDGDNDGYVDCVHVIFAGNRYSSSGTGIIWPFNSAFLSPIVKDGKNISDFIMTPEKLGDVDYKIASIGTICHELGHVLGAPDFYPIGYSAPQEDSLGTGIWDLMGSGSQNWEGYRPSHHNPFTKSLIYQWATPNTISVSEKNVVYNITASSQNADAIYKIPTATTGEYFLLENRQKVSFDSSLLFNGLLIYHITADIVDSIAPNAINKTLPQRCYLVNPSSSQPQPSNIKSYGEISYNIFTYNDPFFMQDNIFFSSQTTPRSQDWNGTATGVDVCFIQHNGSNMKFVVNPQIEGPDTLRLHGVPDSAWYHIRNVPSGATITWSISNQQGKTFQFYFNSPLGRDSILVKFGYNGTPPTPPFPYSSTYDSIFPNLSPQSISYQPGYLSVTISTGSGSNSDSYTINKTIRRRMSGLANPSLACNVNGSTLNVVIGDNQIATDNSANYTLELWNSIYGLMRTKVVQSATEQMDISGLPQGVYVILLKENGNVIAETKVIIQ